MNIHLPCGRAGVLSSAGLLLVSSLYAQSSADPWSRTVALPTACYSSQDQFAERNQAALDAVSSEAAAREEGNRKIDEQVKNVSNANPMELARRMQENMMKDPQNAMKYMQMMTGASIQTEQTQNSEKAQQMQAEEAALLGRYKAARQTAYAPASGKYAAIRKKLGIATGGIFNESGGTPAWVGVEYSASMREADSAYQAICPQWFGAAGAMPAFMRRYREYLVQERIPALQKVDEQKLANYAMFNTPPTTYRSTAVHTAVQEYMKLAARLYDVREQKTHCAGGDCMARYMQEF